MNYLHHYNKLIETRRNREKIHGEYYEKHHIIMQCHGGSNDDENLIFLTAREHFLAHWLLWMIHRDSKSTHAFFCMYRASKNQERKFGSSRIYEELKKSISMEVSKRFKGISKSIEHKEKISLALKNKEKSEDHKKKLSLSTKGITLEEKFGIEKTKEMKKNLSEKFSGGLNPNSKAILRIFEDGSVKEYYGIWDAIKNENLSRHKLRRALRENIEYLNCKWEYV